METSERSDKYKDKEGRMNRRSEELRRNKERNMLEDS